jgi:hypothetical protein
MLVMAAKKMTKKGVLATVPHCLEGDWTIRYRDDLGVLDTGQPKSATVGEGRAYTAADAGTGDT